ncbi:hypothetical protein [Paenibacillus dendritiformis]|nr:hypothetical protein [Paenibacillus dendritiformis]
MKKTMRLLAVPAQCGTAGKEIDTGKPDTIGAIYGGKKDGFYF